MTSQSSLPNEELSPTIDFGNEEMAEQLVLILDRYLAYLKAGRKPDRVALLAEHPRLAGLLAQLSQQDF